MWVLPTIVRIKMDMLPVCAILAILVRRQIADQNVLSTLTAQANLIVLDKNAQTLALVFVEKTQNVLSRITM